MKGKSPKKQFDVFLSKYTPEIIALAKAVLKKMRARLPGAVELVYDNYNALVIGFGPTERASEAIFSIALYPRWVTLFFLKGAILRDPQKLLKGTGKQVRHIVIESEKKLDTPGVRTLMAQALKNAKKPLDHKAAGRMVIRSISARQRPRRPPLRSFK